MIRMERLTPFAHSGALASAVAALLTLGVAVPAFAQAAGNPGLLVHAADDEPSTLDPAQV